MSDEHNPDITNTPAEESVDVSPAEQTEESSHPAGEAWSDVMSQLDALGEAMGRWAKAATSDPKNSERARELKEHMKKMADTVEGAVDEAASTDIGQSFREAAVKTGEAFRAASDRVAGEVSPRVASAFRMTAEKLHQAAERMEAKAGETAAQDAGSVPAQDVSSSATDVSGADHESGASDEA